MDALSLFKGQAIASCLAFCKSPRLPYFTKYPVHAACTDFYAYNSVLLLCNIAHSYLYANFHPPKACQRRTSAAHSIIKTPSSSSTPLPTLRLQISIPLREKDLHTGCGQPSVLLAQLLQQTYLFLTLW